MNERFRTFLSDERTLEGALNAHIHEGWLVLHVEDGSAFRWRITVDTQPPQPFLPDGSYECELCGDRHIHYSECPKHVIP